MDRKIPWQKVPDNFKHAVYTKFNSEVVSTAIAFGGYSNSATFKLELRNGLAIFCKINHPDMTDFAKRSFKKELENFEQNKIPADCSPQFLGVIEVQDWTALFLEWIDDISISGKWSLETTSEVLKKLAYLHKQDSSSLDTFKGQESWQSFFHQENSSSETEVIHLKEIILKIEREASQFLKPNSLIHLDLRSDNILISESRGPLFVDWPYLCSGPALIDLGFFAVSLKAELDLDISKMIKIYERAANRSFNHEEIRAAAVVVTGFFACRCFLPNPDGLINIQQHQLKQYCTARTWLLEMLL